jgi:cell division septum initiation protein DivIVA
MTTVEDESVVPEFAHAVRGYDRYQVDDYIERLNQWAAGAHKRAVDAERTVERQSREIEDLQDRLAELEEHRSPSAEQSLRSAAERTAEMVTAAVTQADEIRRRASADADRRLDEASRQAVSMVEAARLSVAQLSEEAAKERKESRGRVEAVLGGVREEADQVRREADEAAQSTLAEARAEAARLVQEAERDAAGISQRSEMERTSHEDALVRLRAERQEIMEELARLRAAIQALLNGVPGESARTDRPGGADQPDQDDAGTEPPARTKPGG